MSIIKTDGYHREWGISTRIQSEAVYSIALLPYNNLPTVTISYQYAQVTGYIVYIKDVTKTSFTVRNGYFAQSGSLTSVHWQAEGY